MKQNVVFGILLTFILLLIGCLFLKDKEIRELEKELNNLKNNEVEQDDKQQVLTEDELKLEMGAWVTEKQQMSVNKIIYADNSLNIDNIDIKIENGNINIDNIIKVIEDETVVKVTGYFEQASNFIYIYVLTENKNIYKLNYSKETGLTNEMFKKISLDNIDDLVLADVTIVEDETEKTSNEYRVYAIRDREVLLVNNYE